MVENVAKTVAGEEKATTTQQLTNVDEIKLAAWNVASI